ncbi:hypothetical protein QTP70_026681, partial [Hemibagrus guttatus]
IHACLFISFDMETRREETPSDLLRATELHLNTMESEDNDEDYTSDQLYVQSTSGYFWGKRTREQMSEEEENIEEAPPSRRQCLEQEDEEYEVTEQWSSSSSWSSSPILDSIPSIDAHSSSEHFCGMRKRRKEMTDEEDSDEDAPLRTRLRNLGSIWGAHPLRGPYPLLWSIPTIDSSSSDHFWWRMMMRRRELMSGEDNDEEDSPTRWESVEPEDDEFEAFEHIDMERSSSPSWSLSSSLDLMYFIYASTGQQFFAWGSCCWTRQHSWQSAQGTASGCRHPVPKKSSVSCLNDYRPVALTPIIMKCFERLVMSRIKNLLPLSLDHMQFAYRPNCSTDDAIITTLHLALTHLDNKDTYVQMLFIDFSSAFNTIIPQHLTEKLSLLSINNSLCNWILDFLTRRPQSVRIGNSISSTTTLNTGAPQGLRAQSTAVHSADSRLYSNAQFKPHPEVL